jgi:uncharacterized small protein (DUF1192 family)
MYTGSIDEVQALQAEIDRLRAELNRVKRELRDRDQEFESLAARLSLLSTKPGGSAA